MPSLQDAEAHQMHGSQEKRETPLTHHGELHLKPAMYSCRLELDLEFSDPLVGNFAVRAIAHPDGISAWSEVGENVVAPQTDVGIDKPVQTEGAGTKLHRSFIGDCDRRSKFALVVVDSHMLIAADGLKALELVTEEPIADRSVPTCMMRLSRFVLPAPNPSRSWEA